MTELSKRKASRLPDEEVKRGDREDSRKVLALKFTFGGVIAAGVLYALSASTSFPKVPMGLLCSIPVATGALAYYFADKLKDTSQDKSDIARS